MGIKKVPQPPYSQNLAPFDFWLSLSSEAVVMRRIEKMKESVTKVVDKLTQENFHGAFQKLLEQCKCIAAAGDFFEGE